MNGGSKDMGESVNVNSQPANETEVIGRAMLPENDIDKQNILEMTCRCI